MCSVVCVCACSVWEAGAVLAADGVRCKYDDLFGRYAEEEDSSVRRWARERRWLVFIIRCLMLDISIIVMDMCVVLRCGCHLPALYFFFRLALSNVDENTFEFLRSQYFRVQGHTTAQLSAFVLSSSVLCLSGVLRRVCPSRVPVYVSVQPLTLPCFASCPPVFVLYTKE